MVHTSPRDLFQVALLFGSPACILAHNHPTGDALPSEDDVALTKRLTAAGLLVGVEVIDHVVLGERAYYSFSCGRLFREDASVPSAAPAEPPLRVVPHVQLQLDLP